MSFELNNLLAMPWLKNVYFANFFLSFKTLKKYMLFSSNFGEIILSQNWGRKLDFKNVKVL